MAETTFRRLFGAIGNAAKLYAEYDSYLSDLFRAKHWESGAVGCARVLWTAGQQARREDARTFKSPGLYLWGAEESPVYIGISGKGFGSRFGRYIWTARSQCNLARDFEHSLLASGIEGFPPELRAWYAKSYGSSTVRLRGAVRFAVEGIQHVWFALMPHHSKAEIETLERHLVPVANDWNSRRGLRALLNVEFNRAQPSSAPEPRGARVPRSK